MSNREKLLQSINEKLEFLNLKPIQKLGDATKGEIEIVGLREIYDHSKKFFADVKFDVKFPNGNSGEFTVRFAANGKTSDGAVMVTLVNGKFAIVKQWRLPLGRWTHEVPRGMGDKMDTARIHGHLGTMSIGDLPLGTLTRELGEEVMKDAKVASITHLGNIAADSGTHAVTPSVFLVQIQVPEDKLEQKLKGSEDLQTINVELWDTQKVHSEIGQKLSDTFSLASILLALEHIKRLPKL
jgi:hypothetical protein